VFRTDNQIYIFTASGTGAVEAVLMNLVDRDVKTLVPVYGEFSSRLRDATELIGAKTIGFVKDYPKLEDFIRLIEEHGDAEVLLLVYNDTCPGLTLRWLPKIVEALNRALEIILEEIGIDKWIKMHEERAKVMYSAMKHMGFKPVVPEELRSNTIISVYPSEGITPESVTEWLRSNFKVFVSGGMGKWRGKIIRIGNMGYYY